MQLTFARSPKYSSESESADAPGATSFFTGFPWLHPPLPPPSTAKLRNILRVAPGEVSLPLHFRTVVGSIRSLADHHHCCPPLSVRFPLVPSLVYACSRIPGYMRGHHLPLKPLSLCPDSLWSLLVHRHPYTLYI